MKRRSIIPHMTLDRLVELRDGIQYARNNTGLSYEVVREVLLCATHWLDGRITTGQMGGMLESDDLAILRPMPATVHPMPTPAERMVS